MPPVFFKKRLSRKLWRVVPIYVQKSRDMMPQSHKIPLGYVITLHETM